MDTRITLTLYRDAYTGIIEAEIWIFLCHALSLTSTVGTLLPVVSHATGDSTQAVYKNADSDNQDFHF